MLATLLLLSQFGASSGTQPQVGPYKIVKETKVGGEGGFDYLYTDQVNRNFYVCRSGKTNPRITAFNLDTWKPSGELPNIASHGVASDATTGMAFSSSKPVAMWDAASMKLAKTIAVEGRPDGILDDTASHRIFIFSHEAPNVTVLDAKDGSAIGTIDLGGAPEQAQADGKGNIYVDIEDKDSVAVIDSKTLKVTNTFSLQGKGGGNGGLALDTENGILFVACSEPNVMAIMSAKDGSILSTLPIGKGCDGAAFNPDTKEAFSTQGDGTLTIIKEKSPTQFVVEQTVATARGARTIALDQKTGNIITVTAEYEKPAPGQRRGKMIPNSFKILVIGKG